MPALGYFGGWLDGTVSRFVDVLMAFPLFVLAMATVAALGNTVTNVVYATAIINLPFYIRLARAEVNVRRRLGYVEAARVGGRVHARILRVFLPQHSVAGRRAGVRQLGLGGPERGGSFVPRPWREAPTPEWGIMVAEGARFIASGEWWIALFPGVTLMLAVFCFESASAMQCVTSSIRGCGHEACGDTGRAGRSRSPCASLRSRSVGLIQDA